MKNCNKNTTFNESIVISPHLYDWPFKAGIHCLADFIKDDSQRFLFLTIPFSFLTIGSKYGLQTKFIPLSKLWLKNRFTKGHKNWDTVWTLFHPTPRCRIFNNDFSAGNFLHFGLPQINKFKKKLYDIAVFEGIGILMEPFIKAKIKVYRMSDILESLNYPKSILSFEKRIMDKFDIVLTTDETSFRHAISMKSNDIYLLENGVDEKKYSNDLVIPTDFHSIPSPRVIYVGRLEMVDWDLMRTISLELPRYSFVFIGGPIADVPVDLYKKNNIYFLGYKDHADVPNYIMHSDVGIMPFKNIKAVRTLRRPLKLLEYLAGGLPVVSVSYGDLSKMPKEVFTTNDGSEFARQIKKAFLKSKEKKFKNKMIGLSKPFSQDEIYIKFKKILKDATQQA